MHFVDLGESFPTHISCKIWLDDTADNEDSPVNQPASQPITSLVKFARSPRTDSTGFICLLLIET